MRNDRPGCERLRRPMVYVLGFALLGCLVRCEAQNLVPNGSFEEYEVCPFTMGYLQGDRPLHWSSWLNSPDYFNTCAGELAGVDTLVDVPLNAWSFQNAYDGDGYSGVFAFQSNENYREHVGVELLSPLEIGSWYHVSLRANLAWQGTLTYTNGACNRLGVLFTITSNAWQGTEGPFFADRNFAHLFTTEVLTDTADWVLVSGDFLADSAYQYMVIGNFFDDGNVTYESFTDPEAIVLAYYLIDSVNVHGFPSTGWNGDDGTSDGLVCRLHKDHGILSISGTDGEPLAVTLHDVLGRPLAYRTMGSGSVVVQLGDRIPGILIARVERTSGVVCYRFVVER